MENENFENDAMNHLKKGDSINETENVANKPIEAKILKAPSGRPTLQPVEKKENISNPSNIDASTLGWKNIPVEYLPSLGYFYGSESKLYVKSATVDEIRHWSTIQESDQIDVNQKIDFVLSKCVKFEDSDLPICNYKDLLDVDRLFVLLAVRDITFLDGKNKLMMKYDCPKCGHVEDIELNRGNINYFEFPEKLKQFYDSNKRKICIPFTNERDEEEMLEIGLPVTGYTQWLRNYASRQKSQNKFIDEFYLGVSMLFNKDWRTYDNKSGDNLYKENQYKSKLWSEVKISLISEIEDLLIEGNVDTIQHTCKKCGATEKAPLTFRLKSLFTYTNVLDKLL